MRTPAESGASRAWPRVLGIGALDPPVGLVTGALAGTAGSDRARFPRRLSAFGSSGLAFAAPFGFERFARRGTPRRVASLAVAAIPRARRT